MAKQTYQGELDFSTNWGAAGASGLPASGNAIQQFVRQNLANSFRDVIFEPQNGNRLVFFATEQDKLDYLASGDPTKILKTLPLEIAGTTYLVKLGNVLDSTLVNLTTNDTRLMVGCSYQLQSKSFTDTDWSVENVDGAFKVFVDAGGNGVFEEITELRYRMVAGETHTVNVRPFLVSGRNQIRVQVIADNDEHTVGTLTYTAYMSEMYIDKLNLDWHTPFIQGDTAYNLGGFKVVGSLSKTLWVKISDKNGVQQFIGSKELGTSSFTSTPAFFRQSDITDGSSMFPALGTGVYKVDAWLESGSVQSNILTYSIMCVAAADRGTAQLVVANNVAETAFNFDTNSLFQFAIYNKGYSTGKPRITLNGRNEGSTVVTLYDEELEVSTGVVNDYTKNVEWNINGVSGELALYFIALYGNTEMNGIVLDNTGAYEAETSGLTFYMNAANRANSQDDREMVYNDAPLATQRAIPASWENMAWVDGIDGWTVDDNRRKCLLIPAGSRVSIPFSIFANGDNSSFDITFKCMNVADYNENVITMALNPESEGFHGVRIKPTNITVHSNSDNSANGDEARGTNFADEQIVNLFITVARNYGGNVGVNLVNGFVNGVIAFQYSYNAGTVWANDVPIVIGSDTCDTYLYAIHAYSQAHDMAAAEKNYINSMESRGERIEMHKRMSMLLNGSHSIDHDAVKNNKLNFFEIEMLADGGSTSVPSKANGWAKNDAGRSNLTMHFGEHPDWDFTIFNVETSGQGTTSMDYWRWNLRWRIDKTDSTKKCNIAYFNTPTIDAAGNRVYIQKPAVSSKTVKFDGDNHPELMRITAKINMASSMQSHKIGATRSFTAVHDYLMLNDAQKAAQEAGTPMPAVSVYEYPAFGFKKTKRAGTIDTYDYEYIGLFTIGPDKGDKPTFGYDAVKSSLITLEGTDHTPVMATFHYPWHEAAGVAYDATKDTESLGVFKKDGTFEKAWEVSNIHGGDTDGNATVAANNLSILRTEFKPAYEKAYLNNTMIFGIGTNEGYGSNPAAIIAGINADSDFATKQTYFGRYYGDCQFWIDGEYVIYYRNVMTGNWEKDVNLLTQCGITLSSNVTLNGVTKAFSSLTLTEKNEYFRQQRRTYFKNGNPASGFDSQPASAFWDMDDTLFQFCFLIVFGATDNFAKNSYPYKMKTLADGGKWCWRQDDLDTIFDIDNQGKQTKPYFIEFLDKSSGTHYFNGSNSYFWNLVHETYAEEIRAKGRDMLEAMGTLGGGTGSINKLMNFFRKYFWNYAQEYFPKSAYNADAVYKYIDAFIAKGQDVDPLSQSLGDHYRAEYQWVYRRMIYAMSFFRAGAFADRTDSSLGSISFRASVGDMHMKPAIAMYPALHIGASGHQYSEDRVLEGGSTTMNLTSSSDTTVYIPATDWFTSFGDWRHFTVLGENAKALTVTGKRLEEFKIGDADASSVTTNIMSLEFSNTPSLKRVDARNAKDLEGDVDLSGCTRLDEALFEGTKVTSVLVPDGSKVNVLHLSDHTNAIILKRLLNLDMEHLRLPATMEQVSRLQVEKCGNIDALELLKRIVDTADSDADGYRLYARISWDGVKEFEGVDSVIYSEVLNKIAVNPSKYFGLTPNGEPNQDVRPLIEGSIKFLGSMYSDVISNITNSGDVAVTDPETGLTSVVSSKFGTLSIIYNGSLISIRFVDPEVERVLKTALDKDGNGVLTLSEVANATDIPSFYNNTSITHFDEFSLFNRISVIAETAGSGFGKFQGCTSLQSITLPSTIEKIGQNAFRGCSSLTDLNWHPENIKIIGGYAFEGCSSLVFEDLRLPKLTSLSKNIPFRNTNINKISDLGQITTIGRADGSGTGMFEGHAELESVILPEVLTNIDQNAFRGCISLDTVDFNHSATSVGKESFRDCTSLTNLLNTENIKSISNRVFNYSGIRNITFLGLQTITHGGSESDGTFAACSNLETVRLRDIVQVGSYAFTDCHSLTYVEGLDNATSIYHYAFYRCENLAIALNLSNATYIGNFAFSGNVNTQAVNSKATRVTSLYAPKLVNLDTDSPFRCCLDLQTVDLPNCVSINGYGGDDNHGAFSFCYGLTRFNAPNLEVVGARAFNNATALKCIVLPKVNTINYNAFRACNELNLVVLGSSCTSIGSDCFQWDTKVNLVCKATTPPTCGSNIFSNAGNNYGIFVPVASVDSYKAASGWNAYAGNIKGFEEVTSFPSGANTSRGYLTASAFFYHNGTKWMSINLETGDTAAV